MKHHAPYLLIIAALLVWIWLNRPMPTEPIQPTQTEAKRDSVKVVLKSAEVKYDSIRVIHDTVTRTITRVETKWRDTPMLNDSTRLDSCREVLTAYKHGFETATNALAHCDTVVQVQRVVLSLSDTIISQQKDTIKKQQSDINKSNRLTRFWQIATGAAFIAGLLF